MLCYASSAMEEVISAEVLRCRPFGRVAIFVKTSLCAGVKLICKNSRFIITQLGDLILVNVYLPCPGANNWDNHHHHHHLIRKAKHNVKYIMNMLIV